MVLLNGCVSASSPYGGSYKDILCGLKDIVPPEYRARTCSGLPCENTLWIALRAASTAFSMDKIAMLASLAKYRLPNPGCTVNAKSVCSQGQGLYSGVKATRHRAGHGTTTDVNSRDPRDKDKLAK